MRDKILLVLYFFGLISLFLYSYTQVDLGLTLSRNPTINFLQKQFQFVGFFERPLSTYLYVSILILFSVLYIIFLRSAKKGHVTRKQFLLLIGSSALVLNFAYPAFSYDFFNYIFYGKIITFYHQNPYLRTALDFPKDPMLLFMHWTHNTYSYGPFWLMLTVPLSFIGHNIFTVNLFLFKSLMTTNFLGTVYFVHKFTKDKFKTLLFALSPLVIFESLVSSHLDIVMMFFAIWSFYLLTNKKYFLSIVLLILSIGIKFATFFLLPVYLYVLFKKGKVDWEKMITYSTVLMLLSVVASSFRTNFQPWYLLDVLPFAALSNKSFIRIPAVISSILIPLTYVPFLNLGNWDNPVPSILFYLNASVVVLCVLAILIKSRKIHL